MSDSLSGVIIPLIIPVDAPSSLASGVQALAASLETTEFSSACLQLQQSFCYLTWHFADYSARHLQQLGLEHTACSPFGHARLAQHLDALQSNLDKLADAAEAHPEVGDVFRVFYVGGLRARHSSPRRHTRLLSLGGQSIRGYRSILEWCRLELGDEEFSGELRCQRELRRYLPILREWLDSSSGHFRQIKGYDWFDQASTNPTEEGETPPSSPPPAATAPAEALASLKSAPSEAPAIISLASFPTPPLLARHQALFEEQLAAKNPDAFIALGRLAGLAVQYIFAIAGAALRSIGQLDPALEKRLDTGLTLRQKQTSLTFLFKALAQHQNENPLLEQVARSVQAPTGGKLADFLTSTWGGGHTFAEFCADTAKPEPPALWQERFLPGVRAWLQQSAAWFARAEHYFQTPNEQGFVSFTVQFGDEHLEVERKALQLDTAALRIGAAELKQLLAPAVRAEASEVSEPPKVVPAKVEAAAETVPPAAKAEAAKKAEPAKKEEAKAAPAKAEPAKKEEAQAAPAKAEPAKKEEAKAAPAKAEPAKKEEAKAEPAKAEPAKKEVAKEPAKAEPAKKEEAKAEPAKAEPAKKEEAKAEPAKAEPAKKEEAKAEPAKAEPAKKAEAKAPVAKTQPPKKEEPKAEPTEAPEATVPPVAAEETATTPALAAVAIEAAEVASPPVSHLEPPKKAGEQDWSGPALVLELWDESVETREAEVLLKLVSFLIQYTSGVTAEWRELENKSAAPNIGGAVDQVRERLQLEDDSPVIAPLGSASEPGSLSHWLHQPEFKTWLCQTRDYRPELQLQAGRWLEALQPFFKESEQLFEEPAACGTLEGVVVYQDRYLEFVDHPMFVGGLTGAFWSDTPAESTEPLEGAAPVPEVANSTEAITPQSLPESPSLVAEAVAEVGGLAGLPEAEIPPDLSALPACVAEYYEELWSGSVGPEGLAAALEFSIQYYAGLLASVAIHAGALEASHLSAWRSDSNLLQRLEMIQQVLAITAESENETLVSLREIFQGSGFAETWKMEAAELPSLAFALRSGDEDERARASKILSLWVEASRAFLGTLENLAEPIDAKGHLEVVVQQEDNFFELVEPEYAVHLVPPGYQSWQDLPCYRNLSARYGSQELLGKSDGSQELSGSAVSDDSLDFFSAPAGHNYQDKMMEALFKAPEPVPTAKLEAPKPKPQLIQEEEKVVAPTPRSDYQLNTVLEQLLQKPAEEEPPPPPPSAPSEEKEAPAAVTAKLETKAPARLDAPVATEKLPEFIVVDPPKLEYLINYEGKEGQIHTGRIVLKNTGGGNLKGTVKSNHPCLRVNPSVFRSNDAEISYWVDDSDRPSNMQKIGLSFHFSGQKVEVPMEKMLPDKKFKQLATKMLGFVKNLRQKG